MHKSCGNRDRAHRRRAVELERNAYMLEEQHAVRGDTTPRHMVPRGLEPRTLRLLAVRSDQLSYETTDVLSPRPPCDNSDAHRPRNARARVAMYASRGVTTRVRCEFEHKRSVEYTRARCACLRVPVTRHVKQKSAPPPRVSRRLDCGHAPYPRTGLRSNAARWRRRSRRCHVMRRACEHWWGIHARQRAMPTGVASCGVYKIVARSTLRVEE